MSRPTVTIELEDFQSLQSRLAIAEAELAKLRDAADVARLPDDPGILALHEAFLVSTEIVTFAVASLDPIAYRGWPHVALRIYGESLATIPGLPAGLREISVDLCLFAKNAKKWEDARAIGREHDLLAEENARASMTGIASGTIETAG